MKSQILVVATLCLAVGLTVVPAYAQAGYVQAQVPFSFAVLEKTFPAGTYRVIAKPHQVNIQDSNGKTVAMVLANDVSGRSAGENGQIMFHCYGNRCFLAGVWSATGNGRELLASPAEEKMAREEREKYFAVLGERPQK